MDKDSVILKFEQRIHQIRDEMAGIQSSNDSHEKD